MPNTLTQGSGTTAIADAFLYGPEHQRIRQTQRTGTTVNKTIYYAGAIEKTIDSSGSVSVKTYLPQGLGVIIETSSATTPNTATGTATNYFHTDHLGSVGVISDSSGAVKERLSYDPFGKRRNLTGSDDASLPPANLKGVIDNKGYTGHEMLDNIGLIHMNGRVYDPLSGRFISADPFISDPDTSQTFNRYSYVNNNPLAYTDPSGYTGEMKFNWEWEQHDPSWGIFQTKVQSGFGFQIAWDINVGWLSPMQSAQSGMAGGASVTNIASPAVNNNAASGKWQSRAYWSGEQTTKMVDGQEVTQAEKVNVHLSRVKDGAADFDMKAHRDRGAREFMDFMLLGMSGGIPVGPVLGILGKGVSLLKGAKGASEFTRVGRWMSKAEFETMSTTERVVEGAGGRTSVIRPPNSASYTAARPDSIYAEFNVPSSVLQPGGRADWAIIPGPGITTRIFGPAPLEMPAATCIVCVIGR